MKGFFIGVGFLLLGALLFVMWTIGTYNGMVRGEEQVMTAWSNVETQYQRRFDLIPNLVNSVQGILTQEQEIFGEIAQARTQYANSKQGGTQEEQVEAYGQYESVIGRLLLIMENYPELRSYAQVQSLMDELAGTENRVTIARDRYNEAVQTWNVDIRRFPRSLAAGFFGFEQRTRFEAEQGAEGVPTVDLNSKVNTEQ